MVGRSVYRYKRRSNSVRISFLTFCVAACAFLTGCGADKAASTTMVLTGDVSAMYTNGRFVIFDPSKQNAPTSSMVMSTATTAALESSNGTVGITPSTTISDASNDAPNDAKPHPSDSVYRSLNVVAEAEIGEDGRFTLTTRVEEPLPVYFYILYATSDTGANFAPVKGQHFILEAGALSLTMDERSRFVVDGGYYNDAVFNTWRKAPEYIEANEQYSLLIQSVEGESEEERRKRVDASAEKMNHILDLETEGRKHIASTHSDPIVRKLTLQTTWLTGPWFGDAIRALAEDMPNDAWAQDALVQQEAADVRRAQQAQFSEGNQIQDFDAYSLDGTTYNFSEVRNESKLVLLEFWASWCGPCIAEIPHMKQAYERFKSNGFEIVSFTIDEDREDWEFASEEQNIPWIDLGMGPDAPAAVAYGVTGVPKNFLVDAETGVIMATDLRQHKLDEKLEEELL